MRHPKTNNAGSMLVYAVVIALTAAVLFAAIGRIARYNASQFVHTEATNRLMQIAEKGLNEAISELGRNSDIALFDTSIKVSPDDPLATYQNTVQRRDIPELGIYYIKTTVSRTTNGSTEKAALHSYVRVVNVSDYFAAVSDVLTISHGADISGGKIYAPKLVFQWNDGNSTPTRVGSAAFYDTCDPPLAGDKSWPGNVKQDVQILNTPKNAPVQLTAPLFFPQLSDQDMARYRILAGPHTVQNTFSGEIYPPGYSDFTTNEAGDTYNDSGGNSLHTTENTQHVYFFDGDIYLQGRVHGQVLFVATGDIHITGDLRCADNAEALPGGGAADSSKAHQPVVLTKKNIFIDKITVDPNAPGTVTETIQGLFIAPNSSLIPVSYGNETIHGKLVLDFTGSLIMSTLKSTPTLPSIFKAGRTYAYLDSLATNTPPYLPAFAEILYSLFDQSI